MAGTEKIDHPAHYGGASSPYEVIKLVERWGLGFHLGSALKYVARAGKKTPDVLTDLKKARWYLDRAMQGNCLTHVRAAGIQEGGHTSTALAAANVWELELPLLNVVVMIAHAASLAATNNNVKAQGRSFTMKCGCAETFDEETFTARWTAFAVEMNAAKFPTDVRDRMWDASLANAEKVGIVVALTNKGFTFPSVLS